MRETEEFVERHVKVVKRGGRREEYRGLIFQKATRL